MVKTEGYPAFLQDALEITVRYVKGIGGGQHTGRCRRSRIWSLRRGSRGMFPLVVC